MMDTLTAILSWEFQVAPSEKKDLQANKLCKFPQKPSQAFRTQKKDETISDGDWYRGWSPYEILTFFEFV